MSDGQPATSFRVSLSGEGLTVEREVDLEVAWTIVRLLFEHARPPAPRPDAGPAPAPVAGEQAQAIRSVEASEDDADAEARRGAFNAFQRLQEARTAE